MTEKTTVELQKGIWIDDKRLAEAGVQAPLEITVQPGEVRIRSARLGAASGKEEGEDRLLALAGMLEGSPLSADEIEQELYGHRDPE